MAGKWWFSNQLSIFPYTALTAGPSSPQLLPHISALCPMSGIGSYPSITAALSRRTAGGIGDDSLRSHSLGPSSADASRRAVSSLMSTAPSNRGDPVSRSLSGTAAVPSVASFPSSTVPPPAPLRPLSASGAVRGSSDGSTPLWTGEAPSPYAARGVTRNSQGALFMSVWTMSRVDLRCFHLHTSCECVCDIRPAFLRSLCP